MKKITLALSLLLVSQIGFTQSTNPAPYCSATFDDAVGFPVDDHIKSVSFGTLNNVSNSQYAAPHYVFYNNLTTANFVKGSNYTLKVKFQTAGLCGYGVWIDYNKNNVFEASEKVAGTKGTESLNVGDTQTITKSFLIPPSALTGNTRMRVRIVEDDLYNMTTTDVLPCNASNSATDVMDWGETEDYTINITEPTNIHEVEALSNINITPNPSNGLFTLSTDNINSKNIEVISIIGSIIYQTTTNNINVKIDMSNQPKGIYIIRINDLQNQTNAVKKIIIE